jgi:hypothetical protein
VKRFYRLKVKEMKEYIVTPEKKQKIIDQWIEINHKKDEKIIVLKEELSPLKSNNVNLSIENKVLIFFAVLLTILLFSKQIKLLISKRLIKN